MTPAETCTTMLPSLLLAFFQAHQYSQLIPIGQQNVQLVHVWPLKTPNLADASPTQLPWYPMGQVWHSRFSHVEYANDSHSASERLGCPYLDEICIPLNNEVGINVQRTHGDLKFTTASAAKEQIPTLQIPSWRISMTGAFRNCFIL